MGKTTAVRPLYSRLFLSSALTRVETGYVYALWKRLVKKVNLATHTLTSPNDWQSLDAQVHGLCKLPGVEGAKVRRIDILGALVLLHFLSLSEAWADEGGR